MKVTIFQLPPSLKHRFAIEKLEEMQMKLVPTARTSLLVSLLLGVGACVVTDVEQLAPRLEKLTPEEIQ